MSSRKAFAFALNDALTKTVSGAFSYQSALDAAVRQLTQSGLRTVDFKSGVSRQIDTAARNALMTSLGQLTGDIMQANIEASGVPMVQVSSHWGARESHAVWQGGIYTLEQFRAVCGYGEPSNPDHIYSYNCRHSHYPYWPGVSEPIEFDPEPAPVTVNGKTYTYYQATQKQRGMERQIRALKREVNAGGDKAVLGSQIRQKTREYNAFSRACGVRAKTERLQVVGYDRSMSARVRTAITPSSGESMLGGLNRFSALSGDLKERSQQIGWILDKYGFSHESKWSGTTNVLSKERMPRAMGRKEWNCNISLREDSGVKTTVHEHLHARSCSHFDAAVYVNNQRIEEGVVELLAEEICKANGIDFSETYKTWVEPLRQTNSVAKIGETDFYFAKALIDVDLPNRYNWLRDRVDNFIATGSISPDEERMLNIAINTMYGKG